MDHQDTPGTGFEVPGAPKRVFFYHHRLATCLSDGLLLSGYDITTMKPSGRMILSDILEERRVGTVCLILFHDGTITQGASVCSPEDQFSRRIGRDYAFERALECYRSEQPLAPLPWKYKKRGPAPAFLKCKGIFNPAPAWVPGPMQRIHQGMLSDGNRGKEAQEQVRPIIPRFECSDCMEEVGP